jgi:uncharacterized protein (TIGR03083 family)
MLMAERRALHDLLASLDPEQWDAPTLCGDWNVRDLAVHMTAWDDLIFYDDRWGHLRALGRFSWLYETSLTHMGVVNRRLQRRADDLRPAELVAHFDDAADAEIRWLFDGFLPRAHLAEYVLHRLDLTRALGRPDDLPESHLLAALDGAGQIPGVRGQSWRRLRRSRYEATDLDWSAGRGQSVPLPGVEILLQLAGRTA